MSRALLFKILSILSNDFASRTLSEISYLRFCTIVKCSHILIHYLNLLPIVAVVCCYHSRGKIKILIQSITMADPGAKAKGPPPPIPPPSRPFFLSAPISHRLPFLFHPPFSLPSPNQSWSSQGSGNGVSQTAESRGVRSPSHRVDVFFYHFCLLKTRLVTNRFSDPTRILV